MAAISGRPARASAWRGSERMHDFCDPEYGRAGCQLDPDFAQDDPDRLC